MKKIVAIALAVMMLVLAVPFTAFADETLATDVKLGITADNVVFSDYSDAPPKQTALDPNAGTTTVDPTETDGIFKITRDYTSAGHFEIRFAIQNKGKLGANKYLVLWADFSDVEIRKACFGLIENNDYYPYRTDDADGKNTPFYYLADGATEWETLKHGGDGCFGQGDSGSQSMIGKKGYFAFPIADFYNDTKSDAAPTSETFITDVYFFGTFPNTNYVNVPFYFGDFQLVEDYTTVNAPVDEFKTIDSAEEFDAFTKAINAGTYTPAAGSTVKVTAELDMRDITDFQPINDMVGFTLDFDGHTVSNLVVTTTGADYRDGNPAGKQRLAGIIAHLVQNGAAIVNLKLDNCLLNVDARRIGMVAGYVNASFIDNIVVENCTIKATHSGETGGRYVAGVAANIDYSTESFVLNASVKNIVLESDVADNMSAIVCELWKGKGVTAGEISAADVTAKKNGSLVQVTAMPASNVTVPAGVQLVVTNVDNATGYTDPTAPEIPDVPETPETPETPAPTGDMTIILATVALVSLAAVTVIAKKKVTE